MPKAKRAGGRLTKFLQRYSTPNVKAKLNKLYAQWILVEVRDAGRKDDLICPCGQTGLRYLCFIRNKETKIQTYVGSTCIRNFSHKIVPRLLKLMESLSISGVSGKYLGKSGKTHRFQIKDSCKLIRCYKLMAHFFSKMPIERGEKGFEIKIIKSHSRHPKDYLRKGYWYNMKLGPVTKQNQNNKGRPELIFFADMIRELRI